MIKWNKQRRNVWKEKAIISSAAAGPSQLLTGRDFVQTRGDRTDPSVGMVLSSTLQWCTVRLGERCELGISCKTQNTIAGKTNAESSNSTGYNSHNWHEASSSARSRCIVLTSVHEWGWGTHINAVRKRLVVEPHAPCLTVLTTKALVNQIGRLNWKTQQY